MEHSNVTFDNGIVISGTQQPIINGDRNLWAIKTNSEGFVEWDRSFEGMQMKKVMMLYQPQMVDLYL